VERLGSSTLFRNAAQVRNGPVNPRLQSGELQISSPRTTTPPRGPRTWKLTLAYDGTDFRGWQVQPGQPTVQGELQAAISRVVGESPLPQGSGRTDAGVHALAQVASFGLQAGIPAESLRRALNRTLPDSIRVLEANTAPSAFHARHSAVAKTYEYRVFLERPAPGRPVPCPPFLARYVYSYLWPLDFEALQEAARIFIGTQDFLSFAATDPDAATRAEGRLDEDTDEDEPGRPGAVRTIFGSSWEKQEIEDTALFVYRVRGSGFLHHMVRNLVGTMLDVGRGYRRADEIPAIIEARARAAAGPTAPARGLFLHSVEYPQQG
jgi:tRNA pseudouridine38-40 synthase